jgi:hypothetical protein
MTVSPLSVIRHAGMLEIMPTWSLDEENTFVS